METVLAQARAEMLPLLKQGKRMVLTVKTETRGSNLNAQFHAILAQIAEQTEVGGHKFDAASLKRLLVDAFRHETRNDPEFVAEWKRFGHLRLVPALNHEGLVAMGEQTRDFSSKLARAFVLWLEAFAADHNVVLMAPKSWEER